MLKQSPSIQILINRIYFLLKINVNKRQVSKFVVDKKQDMKNVSRTVEEIYPVILLCNIYISSNLQFEIDIFIFFIYLYFFGNPICIRGIMKVCEKVGVTHINCQSFLRFNLLITVVNREINGLKRDFNWSKKETIFCDTSLSVLLGDCVLSKVFLFVTCA